MIRVLKATVWSTSSLYWESISEGNPGTPAAVSFSSFFLPKIGFCLRSFIIGKASASKRIPLNRFGKINDAALINQQ